MFIDYNPKKHKGQPLFERVDDKGGGTWYRAAKVEEEVAAKTPWYYVVQVKKAIKSQFT